MREIKFRVWDMERKSFNSTPENILVVTDNDIQLLDNDRFKLMQYTGLKDKNGKEIYEGDLFFFSKYSNLPAEVYWDERWCGWRGEVNGEMQFDKTYDISPIKFTEVIGNIYENPELVSPVLKAEKE